MILSQVLACDATLGYEDLFNTQVLKFNGAPRPCYAKLGPPQQPLTPQHPIQSPCESWSLLLMRLVVVQGRQCATCATSRSSLRPAPSRSCASTSTTM